VGLDIEGETVQQTGSSFLWWMLMVWCWLDWLDPLDQSMHIHSYTVSFSPCLFYFVTLRKRSYSQLEDTRLHLQQLNINKDFQVIITEELTDGHLLLW